MMDDEIIRKSYTDRRRKGAYAGLAGFTQNSQFKNHKQVENALLALPAYALHKNVVHKFPRRVTRVFWRNWQLSCDLMDVSNWSSANNGIKFILIAQDCFSRKAYTYFLRDKTGKSSNWTKVSISRNGNHSAVSAC